MSDYIVLRDFVHLGIARRIGSEISLTDRQARSWRITEYIIEKSKHIEPAVTEPDPAKNSPVKKPKKK